MVLGEQVWSSRLSLAVNTMRVSLAFSSIRWRIGAVAFAVSLVGTSRAMGQPPNTGRTPTGERARSAEATSATWLQLKWEAPRGCAAAPVRTSLAETLSSPPSAVLLGSCRVVPVDDAYRLEVITSVAGERTERSLVVESCEAAQKAAALLLSLSVRPAQEPTVPEAPAGVTQDESQASSEQSDKARKWQWLFSGQAIGQISRLPLAVGPRLAVGWRDHGFELAVAGAYFPEREASQADVAVTASVEQWRAELVACARVRWARLVVLPCLRGGADHYFANSSGIAEPGSDRQWLIAGAVGFDVALPMTGWLSARLGLEGRLSRIHRFRVRGVENPVLIAGGAASSLSLGLDASF